MNKKLNHAVPKIALIVLIILLAIIVTFYSPIGWVFLLFSIFLCVAIGFMFLFHEAVIPPDKLNLYNNVAVAVILIGIIIPFLAPISSLMFPETSRNEYERTIQPNDTYNTTVGAGWFFDEEDTTKVEILLSTTPSVRLNVTVEEKGTEIITVNETTPITIKLEKKSNGFDDYALKIQNPNNSTINVLKKETSFLRPFTGFSYGAFSFIGLFVGIIVTIFGLFFYRFTRR